MADYFCTFCGCRHEPLAHCQPASRAEGVPGEIVDAVALALYECEKRRADKTDRVIAAARGIPTAKPSMEDWEDCADIFTGDAKAAINAYLDAAFPIAVGTAA